MLDSRVSKALYKISKIIAEYMKKKYKETLLDGFDTDNNPIIVALDESPLDIILIMNNYGLWVDWKQNIGE